MPATPKTNYPQYTRSAETTQPPSDAMESPLCLACTRGLTECCPCRRFSHFDCDELPRLTAVQVRSLSPHAWRQWATAMLLEARR